MSIIGYPRGCCIPVNAYFTILELKMLQQCPFLFVDRLFECSSVLQALELL